MNREFSDRAIVLGVKDFRDSDVVVKFISSRHGILSCFAFGGKRSRRRFPGCLEELNHVIFKIKSTRMGGYLFLEEGILLDRFSNLHTSPGTLGIAKNCQKFVESLMPEFSSNEVFDIFLQLLRTLNQERRNGIVPSAYWAISFRVRIAKEMGWFPEIESCNSCRRLLKAEPYVGFHPRQGQLYCRKCKTEGTILFSQDSYKRIKNILLYRPEFWNQPLLRDEEVMALIRALDIFIRYNMRVIWDRGRFIHI